jgi:hypothetical protein
LKQSQIIVAVSFTGVSVRFKQRLILSELKVRFIGGHLQDNDAKAAHQKGAIDHFVMLFTSAIVKYHALRIVFVPE